MHGRFKLNQVCTFYDKKVCRIGLNTFEKIFETWRILREVHAAVSFQILILKL